jgi:hypothetical protein
MELFIDPTGPKSKKFLASMPADRQKKLMDDIESTIKVKGWSFLRRKE